MNRLLGLVLGFGRRRDDLAAIERASSATRKAWAEARQQTRGTVGRA